MGKRMDCVRFLILIFLFYPFFAQENALAENGEIHPPSQPFASEQEGTAAGEQPNTEEKVDTPAAEETSFEEPAVTRREPVAAQEGSVVPQEEATVAQSVSGKSAEQPANAPQEQPKTNKISEVFIDKNNAKGVSAPGTEMTPVLSMAEQIMQQEAFQAGLLDRKRPPCQKDADSTAKQTGEMPHSCQNFRHYTWLQPPPPAIANEEQERKRPLRATHTKHKWTQNIRHYWQQRRSFQVSQWVYWQQCASCHGFLPPAIIHTLVRTKPRPLPSPSRSMFGTPPGNSRAMGYFPQNRQRPHNSPGRKRGWRW